MFLTTRSSTCLKKMTNNSRPCRLTTLIFSVSVLFSNILAQQNSVTVTLNTKFLDSGYGAEIAEYLAQNVNQKAFFNFLQKLNGKLNNDQTTADQYEILSKTALHESKLSDASFEMLEFTLASRSLSAKVSATSQIGEQIILDGACNTFIQITSTKGDCLHGLNRLDEIIAEDNKIGVPTRDIIPGEHIFPSTNEDNVPLLILYGLPEEPRFHTIFNLLQKLAEQDKIRLAIRFFIRGSSGAGQGVVENSSNKIRLSGYGIEMAIKSQEYKAVDDSKVEASNQEDENTEKKIEFKENEEIEGIDFAKLAKAFPDENLSNLNSFRQHLVDSGNELTPLKAWQVQDLSYQSVAYSMKSEENMSSVDTVEGQDPNGQNEKTFRNILNKLEDVSQNFPSKSKKLVRTKPSQRLRWEIEEAQKILQEHGISDGETKLYLNGNNIEINPDMAQVLERQLLKDSKVLDKLTRLGTLAGPDVKRLSRFKMSSSGSNNYILDMRSPDITWLNNIKKDRQYSNWPSDWSELLRPTWPGYLHKIKENFVNIAVFIDPASAKSLSYLDMLEVYWQNDVPARLGLVFVDSDSSIKSKYLRIAFNKISTKEKALKWLATIHRKWENSDESGNDLSEEYVKEKCFKKFGGEEKFLKLVESDQGPNNYFSSSGLKNIPNMIINGESIPDQILNNPEDYLERGVYQIVGEQLNHVARDIYYKKIDMNNKDYFKLIMSKDNVVPRLNQIILKGPYSFPEDEIVDEKAENYDAGKVISLLVRTDSESVKEILADEDENSFKNINIQYLKARSEDSTFINCNGRSYGPFDNDKLTKSDIQLIISMTKNMVIDPIMDSKDAGIVSLTSYDIFEISKVLFDLANESSKSSGESGSSSDSETDTLEPNFLNLFSIKANTGILRSGDNHATHELILILNPVNEQAQIAISVAKTLRQAFSYESLKVVVIFNCKDLSEMPIKNYYRYVLSPKPAFDKFGNIDYKLNSGYFENLPNTLLLTLNLKHPEAWAVEQFKAAHDLDNLKFEQIEANRVYAEFELEYVLLEGHCYDKESSPPRGLQFQLSNQAGNIQFDTIVMANLGYFQLKSEPGVWNLKLREGPSDEIYHISKYEGSNGIRSRDDKESYEKVKIIVDNYYGINLDVSVDRNVGMESKDVLEESAKRLGNKAEAPKKQKVKNKKEEATKPGIWDSVKNMAGFGSDDDTIENLNLNSEVTTDSEDVINIFSLASGHLYERFFRIMMVSVRRHTNAKLRFWALKNYASPGFKNSATEMEKKYNIEINFVQYKWPKWLRRQREKQRTMWGYKILFLDVLFPLNIEKIIFVDADQIVRTDLRELRDLDLEGNPYGYTPFCSDRKEMDGFRFWNQGYWRNHLGHRSYHISAIYVVDLNKFRELAAGDRLRGQYQGLSADPNSLSNLDQDLPNNMIHQVGIKSLPQEWLWCETWCSDKSKTKAKTIDLCNNPLTKEPKLEAAVRIVPEWEDIDNEIKALLNHSNDAVEIEQEKVEDAHEEL